MSTTNNPGAGTPYALEIRTEALKLISVAPSSRHGEADQLVLGHGDGVKRDIVARARTAHIGGNLSESSDSRATMAKRILTTVGGHLSMHGHADTTLLGGAMTETHLAGSFLAAGMSDDLIIGAGARVTVPADLWLSGLVGMEEKIGTAVADGALVELYGVAMEREYGPGVHNAGAAVFSGSLHATAAAGFRPLFRIQQGIRNLTPGGGGGGGASASGPPAPASPPAGGSEAMLVRSAAESGDGFDGVASFADIARAADTVGSAEDTRQFDRASVLDDTILLARTAEDGNPDDAATAAFRRLEDVASWPQADEVANTDAGEDVASVRQVDQSGAPATGNWWDSALDDDGVWMTRLFGDSDSASGGLDETEKADETESVEELWAHVIIARERADDLWQRTTKTNANPNALNLTSHDVLQSAYLESGDLARDMLRPYVDELDLPPKMGPDGRPMTNTEIVDGMDRSTRFRSGGLDRGEDGRLVRPPTSEMPPFQARDAFISHMESARAAGDMDKADSMQATLKSFDAHVSGKMQQALDYAEDLQKWDGIPLAGHIDQQKLTDELLRQKKAVFDQPAGGEQLKIMADKVYYYQSAIDAVEQGLDPTPYLAELESVRNFGNQVNSDTISGVRLAVNSAMDNPGVWNSATAVQPATGGYLNDLADMRKVEIDVYRAEGIRLPSNEILTRAQEDATDFANIRLNEVLQAHGMEPESQALSAAEVRARLHQLRGDYFRAGEARSAWEVQRSMDMLDLQISEMVKNHINLANELAKSPPLADHIDAAPTAARLEELISAANARASELEAAGDIDGARRGRDQANIFSFALDELRNVDSSGNPAPRDPRSLIDYQVVFLRRSGAEDAKIQAVQDAANQVDVLLGDTRRFDLDTFSNTPAQRAVDFDGAVYANVGAGVDGPGSAAGPTQEWIVPPAVQEPSPQRWDIPQLDIDIDQLDVEGLNLADNPGGAASPTPDFADLKYESIDDLALQNDFVKAPGWSEPPGGPSRASPKLETGGTGAGWIEPDASSNPAPELQRLEYYTSDLVVGEDGVPVLNLTLDDQTMSRVNQGLVEIVVLESPDSPQLLDPNSHKIHLYKAQPDNVNPPEESLYSAVKKGEQIYVNVNSPEESLYAGTKNVPLPDEEALYAGTKNVPLPDEEALYAGTKNVPLPDEEALYAGTKNVPPPDEEALYAGTRKDVPHEYKYDKPEPRVKGKRANIVPQPGDPNRTVTINQFAYHSNELEVGADGVDFILMHPDEMALVDEGIAEVKVYDVKPPYNLRPPDSYDVRATMVPPSPRQKKVSDWTFSLGAAVPSGPKADFADVPGGDDAYNRIYGADPDRKTWARLPVPGESTYDSSLALHYGKSAGEAGVSIDPSDVSAPAVIGVDGVDEPLYAAARPKTEWTPIPEGLSDDLLRVDGDDAHIHATLESPSTLAGGLPEDDLDDGMLAIENIYAVVNRVMRDNVMREVEPEAGSVAVVDDGFGKRIYATVKQGTPPERSTEYLGTALDGSATHDRWGASGSRFSGQSGGDDWISPAMVEQAEWSGNAIMDDGLSRMLAQPEPSSTEWFNDLWPSKLDEMQSEWMDDTLRYAGPEAVEDARPAAAAPASPAPVNEASNRLPADFDQQGALTRVDRDIARQRENINLLAQSSPDSPKLIRLQSELDARLLAHDELSQGRDPRPAILARADELVADQRAAYIDTASYYDKAGVFSAADQRAASGKRGLSADFDARPLLSEWRKRTEHLGLANIRPTTEAEFERAEALSEAEAFMRQAIVAVSQGHDPRPDLLRHAENFEAQRFVDGYTGDGEANMLRAMVNEYSQLLQEVSKF